MINKIRERWAKVGEAIATQDNRITGSPIFAVQQKVRDPGYCDADWAEGYEWRNNANDFCLPESDEEDARLNKMYENGEETGDWEKFFYQERWEFVQPFFTEAGAEEYILTNSHNLNEPRIYVYSAYRNPEWAMCRTAPKDIAGLLARVEELEGERDEYLALNRRLASEIVAYEADAMAREDGMI